MLEDRLRRPTLMALSNTLDSKSRDHVRVGTVCIELLIRSAAELGAPRGSQSSFKTCQTTGPNRRQSKLNTVTQGDYFAILARLILAEPNLFVQMLGSVGNVNEVWSWLSAGWFSYQAKMDNIDRQKLYLLGLTRLLELGSPMQELVLDKLQDYLDLWTNIIIDLQDGSEVNGSDCLIWGDEVEVSEYDTPKMILEKQNQHKDPIHCVNALHFVKVRLHDVVARIGGEAVFQENWAVNVDKEVMDAFQKLMNGGRFEETEWPCDLGIVMRI
ncbi:hypothetical protein TrVFT333_003265 [Trichoderma virens FT-333]|nr:hypothetical protein TrVFT333_003265 [Trichoderma virens FT-333]